MSDKLVVEGINSAGFGIIPKLVMQDRGLTVAAKAIYAYFIIVSGKNNKCSPSRNKICSDLGISKDTFSKHLKDLLNCGYLSVRQVKEMVDSLIIFIQSINSKLSHLKNLCSIMLKTTNK